MRNSETKPPSFFAQHVRSLVICSDIKTQLVVEILSVCRGIVNFSYWATPSLSVQQPSSSRFMPIYGDGGSLNEVTPQRMSVLLHENHIYPLKPHFNLAFFSAVTCLSILNSWEEWTTWTHICSDVMPALTHIKFDMNVQRSGQSRSSNMGIETDLTRNNLYSWNELEVLTTPESLRLDMKLSRVANTLTEVLKNCPTLRVCILVLRFDTDPTYTAKIIIRHASQKLLGNPVLAKTATAGWFDSRLVFAHEREPFRYSHAHSKHEMKLWKSAEAIVDSQRHVAGRVYL